MYPVRPVHPCWAAAALLLVLSAGCAKESLLGVESPGASYWKGYYHDAGEALWRPREWEGRDWLVLTGLAGATFALGAADADIRDAVLDSESAFTEDLAGLGDKMGSLSVLLPGLVAGYGLGCAFDDPRLKEASLLGTEGLVLSALATRALKHLVGRERPYEESGPGAIHGPACEDWTSWPSGHSTAAFAVATAFHLEYRNKWVSILAYTLAAVGGWSRIHDDMHWASDVLAGATIGIVTTNAVFRARRRRGR